MATGNSKTSLVTLIFVLISTCHCSSVPFVSWWNYESVTSSTVLAGHSLDKRQFEALYKPILSNADVLVFFTQDELSMDDFTRYSGSFPFTKKSLERKNHIVLPSVLQEEGTTVMEHVESMRPSKVITLPTESDPTEVKDQLQNDILNIISVKLEPIRKAENKVKADILKSNDNTINTIVSKFSKLSKKMAVVLSSEALSLDVTNILINEELDNDHNIKRRHILADSVSDMQSAKVVRSDCVTMYLEKLTFYKNGNTNDSSKTIFDVDNSTKHEGECNQANEGIYQIILTAKNGFKLTMNLEDVNSTGEWACNTIVVKGTFEGADVDETMKCGLYGIPWMENSYNNIISPTQYSFACNQMQFSGKNYTVQFNGLQLQTGNSSISAFKNAYNCEGFFTLGILTGLLIGLLLIASLFLGTTMLMNIQVQDRFDDPKGKTINVGGAQD